MLFGKRKIKVRKYRPKKFETYSPVKKVGIQKDEAVPFILRIGNWFLFFGGMISFFVSSLFLGVCGVLGLRRNVRKVFPGKVVDLS